MKKMVIFVLLVFLIQPALAQSNESIQLSDMNLTYEDFKFGYDAKIFIRTFNLSGSPVDVDGINITTNFSHKIIHKGVGDFLVEVPIDRYENQTFTSIIIRVSDGGKEISETLEIEIGNPSFYSLLIKEYPAQALEFTGRIFRPVTDNIFISLIILIVIAIIIVTGVVISDSHLLHRKVHRNN